jgi:hypothetical protein
MNRILAAGALALLATGTAWPAAARTHHHHHAAASTAARASHPGQKEYALIEDHDPRRLQRAARPARDMVSSGQVQQFRIILSGRATLLAIPGSNNVQKEVVGIVRRYPAIRLVVCSEVVDALAKAAHRRPPLLPGTEVMTCNGLGSRMEQAGWETVPGL